MQNGEPVPRRGQLRQSQRLLDELDLEHTIARQPAQRRVPALPRGREAQLLRDIDHFAALLDYLRCGPAQ